MAYKKFTKHKVKRHVSDFEKHKKLCQLNKNRSPLTMLFCTEDLPDEWLIDVVEYKTVSGEVIDTYYINKSELERYIKFCGKDGFDILTKF